MDKWLELQTAFYVAKLGSVSKASEKLNTHRATVIRHINKLEESFSGKLFIRHAKGYETTELGREMLKAAEAAQLQFDQLAGAAKVKENFISGEIIVTSLDINCAEMLPMLKKFQARHPNAQINYAVSTKLAKLEYGEAHVAIRIGSPGEELDCVVRPFMKYAFALFAHKNYVAEFGEPTTIDELRHHRFVSSSRKPDPAPFIRWLRSEVDPQNITFVSDEHRVLSKAIEAGFGVGFLPVNQGRKNPDLIEILQPNEEWAITFRIVTHGDIHRSPKIVAFLDFFKDPANYTNDFAEVCVFNQ